MDVSINNQHAKQIIKNCSCGYKCDCLQLIIKNKVSTKRLFLRLEKENEPDLNFSFTLEEFGINEIINHFNHFKYCKAYHSIFHENKFDQIKRKPYSFYCLHHIENNNLNEKPHIIHQLINNSQSSQIYCSELECSITNRFNQNGINLENENNSIQNKFFLTINSPKEVIQILNLENDNEKNNNLSKEVQKFSSNNTQINNVQHSSKFNSCNLNVNYVDEIPLESKKSLCTNFKSLQKYLNPFLCLLNILLIIIDFFSDVLMARQHFVEKNFISTAVTMCFIYWAAYMNFLFHANFGKRLDFFKKKFRFINLNNISTDLLIGIIHLFMPVKIFLESIYLVYNMYRWELRLINCRNKEKHQDLEVALRISLRKAHKSNLIVALFEAFPQFLYQLFFVLYYINDHKISWLQIVTIISSLTTYIKNSYSGDLYHIEDHLNKNFEELRFLEIIKFNYLPFSFKIVLFIYNLTGFLLNFPFFIIFYQKRKFIFADLVHEHIFYLFIVYIFIFVKSYISFFKDYLISMKLGKTEEASWKKDVLFIRQNSQFHVNYLFVLILILSTFFIVSMRNDFDVNYYFLIIFSYLMLLTITFVGYVLKVTIIADQLINLKNLLMWKKIFCHLENLNGFGIYNEKLFTKWIEKLLFKNYYFQWKVILYNTYHLCFNKK